MEFELTLDLNRWYKNAVIIDWNEGIPNVASASLDWAVLSWSKLVASVLHAWRNWDFKVERS